MLIDRVGEARPRPSRGEGGGGGEYRLEVALELLEAVAAGHLGGEERGGVHVADHRGDGAPAHAAAAGQQQGAAGPAQDAVHAGHEVQHLVEQQDVQFTVVPPVHHNTLHAKRR